MRIHAFIPAVAATIAATAASAQTAPTILPDATILEVSAIGKVTRTPDLATIRAGVVTQAATAAAATGHLDAFPDTPARHALAAIANAIVED